MKWSRCLAIAEVLAGGGDEVIDPRQPEPLDEVEVKTEVVDDQFVRRPTDGVFEFRKVGTESIDDPAPGGIEVTTVCQDRLLAALLGFLEARHRLGAHMEVGPALGVGDGDVEFAADRLEDRDQILLLDQHQDELRLRLPEPERRVPLVCAPKLSEQIVGVEDRGDFGRRTVGNIVGVCAPVDPGVRLVVEGPRLIDRSDVEGQATVLAAVGDELLGAVEVGLGDATGVLEDVAPAAKLRGEIQCLTGYRG